MSNINITLNTQDAAHYLSVAPISLRNSRLTGILGDKTCPVFRKIGRKVIYLVPDLDKWLNELTPYKNTTEYKLGANDAK